MISPIQTPGLRFAAAYHGVLDDWNKDNECISRVLNFLFYLKQNVLLTMAHGLILDSGLIVHHLLFCVKLLDYILCNTVLKSQAIQGLNIKGSPHLDVSMYQICDIR